MQACGVANVVVSKLGNPDRDQQAEHALHRREERLRQAIFGDASDELWPDRVADSEQEHEKDRRLKRR